jgi:hypothetical protein
VTMMVIMRGQQEQKLIDPRVKTTAGCLPFEIKVDTQLKAKDPHQSTVVGTIKTNGMLVAETLQEAVGSGTRKKLRGSLDAAQASPEKSAAKRGQSARAPRGQAPGRVEAHGRRPRAPVAGPAGRPT